MHVHRLGVCSCLLAAPTFLAANAITGPAWRHPPVNWATAVLLIFVLAYVGMLVASLARRSPVLGPMRDLSLAMGLTGLAGTTLVLARVDLGFGVGAMVRLAVFPMLVWTVAVAVRRSRGARPDTAEPAIRPGGAAYRG
jgi:hypothetical protein